MTEYTTPNIKDKKVKECCSMLSKNSEPVLIKNTPAPNAEYHLCGINVQNHINVHHGELEYGWIIWKLLDIYFDAEAHAIWIDEKGIRHDITPHEESVDSILFLPNHDYIGQIGNQYNAYPPNYLYPCTDSPLAKQFVSLVNMANYKYFEKVGNSDFAIEAAINYVFSTAGLDKYRELKKLLFPEA